MGEFIRLMFISVFVMTLAVLGLAATAEGVFDGVRYSFKDLREELADIIAPDFDEQDGGNLVPTFETSVIPDRNEDEIHRHSVIVDPLNQHPRSLLFMCAPVEECELAITAFVEALKEIEPIDEALHLAGDDV